VRSRLGSGASLLATLLALAACGGGERAPAGGAEAPAPPELEGSARIAGADADRWSLLSVPRDGGFAAARSVADPSAILWEGRTELPPVEHVHLLEGPLVVLRGQDGTVHRYDPRRDSVEAVGRVSPEARWSGWGAYGVLADRESSSLLEIGPEGAWRYELRRVPAWAAAVGDGTVAVLADGEGGSGTGAFLWLIRRGESNPASERRVTYASPGLVTAWGRRLVFSSGEGLRFVAPPTLSEVGEADLEGSAAALATSPSTHMVYVAASSPPRILQINRFTRTSRTLVELRRPARDLRPAASGGFLLADDGGDPLWIPIPEGPARRFEAEWRPDLPLGTPSGEILLVRAGELRLRDPRTGRSRPVEAPVDDVWAAVRWNPAPPAVVAERVEGAPLSGRGDASTRSGAEPDPEVPSGVAGARGTDGEGGGAGEAAGAVGVGPAGASGEGDEAAADPISRVDPGFYAIGASAREEEGVRRLLDRLEDAGYPVRMQRHRDDAGRLWHRGLVGPYRNRAEAEAAARQLRREQDLKVWVTEVEPRLGQDDLFR